MHNLLLCIWLAYLIGQLLHYLLKASAAVGSPNCGITGYADYFHKNWLSLTIRFCLATAIFILLAEYGPNLIIGMGVMPIDGGNSGPTKCALAFLVGYCSDSILDKVQARFTILQGQLPS